jgi:DNA helicase-2/ATP-dependent DNA helicase PcrA
MAPSSSPSPPAPWDHDPALAWLARQDWPTERKAAWVALRNTLRPGQREMADWTGGPLAVSAVPGAGKSTGMARAAALAIARFGLHSQRQLLLVTFTRSAAANLRAKVRSALRSLGVAGGGFAVQTLHGLAFQIASRHRDRADLPDTLTLAAPTRQHRLMTEAIDQWIDQNPDLYGALVAGVGFDGEEAERLRRQSVLRTEVLPDLVQSVVREAKSSGLTVADLQDLAAEAGRSPTPAADLMDLDPEPSLGNLGLTVAAGLYGAYERVLRSRGLMDYDDMILGALAALRADDVRHLWQGRIFAIFEDEAQDSSPLQNQLLEQLAAPPGSPLEVPFDALNLVRVGDPNQAINSTFTPADPIFFRRFCDRCRTLGRLALMDCSGRSSPRLMAVANHLLTWVNRTHTGPSTGDRPPFEPQTIRPVAPDDPQPDANPSPLGSGLRLEEFGTIQASIARLGQLATALFERDPGASAAVLVRTNDQGRWVAKTLAERWGDRLNLYELGARDRQTQVPSDLLALLQFIDRPHSPDRLKGALKILRDREQISPQDLDRLASRPERFLYPGPLDDVPAIATDAQRLCRQWLDASFVLPPYSLLSYLAASLGYSANELATADKLIDLLSQRAAGSDRRDRLLPHLAEMVYQETFEPVEAEATDDSQATRAGQLAILTMHKAKGLDWDAVFIPFLQASVLPGSPYVPTQRHFLGPHGLADTSRAQLRSHLHGDRASLTDPAIAWNHANGLKLAEEYRLFYVALTRAKRFLWLATEADGPFSWSDPDRTRSQEPSPAFLELAHAYPNAPPPNPNGPLHIGYPGHGSTEP